MRIQDHVLAEISDRLPIVDIVSEHVALEKRGGRYWGLCPFHQEKTPSFTVNPERGAFYCFGCQKGGSLFTFVMEMEKLTFPEAVRLLAERAGVEIEPEEKGGGEREAYLELYRRVAGSFHYLLMNHSKAVRAREYLDSRKIRSETLEAYQVGYAPPERDWLARLLRKNSFSPEFMKAAGLFSEREGRLQPLFRDRIVFPIANNRGEIVGFGGRTLMENAQGPKYLNTPETMGFHKGSLLYGAPDVFKKIREAGSFILVEGYMDVLALFQAGMAACVAPLGTALTPSQIRLLKRYAQQGLLLFDGDDAGFKAAGRAAVLCEQMNLPVEVIELPEGRDPAEIMEQEGPENLQKMTKYPINTFQFLLKRALGAYDKGTPEGKEGIFRFLQPFLQSIDSHIKRDGYLQLLAEALGVEAEAVRRDLVKGAAGSFPAVQPRSPSSSGTIPGTLPLDLYVLLAVAGNREYFSQVRRLLEVDDLEDPRARQLFIALEECFRSEARSLEALLERLQDEELRKTLLERIARQEFSENQEQLILDGVRKIRQRRLERKRDRIDELLASAGAQGMDDRGLKELLAEKIYLDGELKNLKVMWNARAAE